MGRHDWRDVFQPLAEAAWLILVAYERNEGFELDHVLSYINHHVPINVIEERRRLSAKN